MGFQLFDGHAAWDDVGVGSTAWFDDAPPADSSTYLYQAGWDTGNWVAADPAPASGGLSLRTGVAPGMHQLFFEDSPTPLDVDAGDVLSVYVYLDPDHVPDEVMIQWQADDSSWEHRAYWGADSLAYGTDGTASRRRMGALPAAGGWVRLLVPASLAGLEGTSLTGIGLTLHGGRAAWDRIGKFVPSEDPTELYYSAAWQVVEERQGGTATADVSHQYVWSPVYVDAMVLRDDYQGGTRTGRLYAQQDANFNTTALVDDSGMVVERFVYAPYGAVTVLDAGGTPRAGNASAYGWQYLYQGSRLDTATGWYDDRNREYIPSEGRFAQRDPLGLTADLNSYRFVGSNPANQLDPSGLKGEHWFNDGWTDWINPFAYIAGAGYNIAASGYAAGERIGAGLGALVHADPGRAINLARVRQLRALEEAAEIRPAWQPQLTVNEIVTERRQAIFLGLQENVQYATDVGDGALATAELGLEVYTIVEGGLAVKRFASGASAARAATSACPKTAGVGVQAPKAGLPVPNGFRRVYRAVSEAEYQDALQSGQFKPGPPNSYQSGRWFADTLESAQAQGNKLYPDGKFRLLEADIPGNAPSMYQHPNMDQLGPATYLDFEDLNGVVPRPVQ
jgi:RHS repeat-associated protein